MKKPVLCDLRNLYEPDEVEAAGWTYVGVGRGRAGVSKARARKRTGVRRAARRAPA